jgi:hypothetical protein
MPDLLTDDERKAIADTAQLWNLLGTIVGHGPTRVEDLNDLCTHIHAIQRTVMKQAAARAYPDRYRLLGGTVGDDPGGPLTDVARHTCPEKRGAIIGSAADTERCGCRATS